MNPDSAAAAVVELDRLELLVVVDNETDTLSSVDDGIPQVPEAARLAARLPASRTHDGHACTTVFDHLCCACHGYSVLLRGTHGTRTRSILFDVGPYADVWLANARRLNLDLTAIERVFLSHWHWDHSGALPVVLAAIVEARRAAGIAEPLVVDVHPDRPDQRGVQLPGGNLLMLPEEPSFAQLAASGATVVRVGAPQALADGFFYASGAIARVTAYETGLAGHHSFRADQMHPDPLIMDERFLAARVRGRGVSVLSACSHAGIVNACLAARAAFPADAVDVVLGGYHLAGKVMEARIEDTVRDLAALIAPRIVAPGHCTGWRAKHALATAFAPGRYAPSVVGSSYVLTASAH